MEHKSGKIDGNQARDFHVRPSAQSAQRYPITTMFGTEANVRLLRALARHGGQLSGPDLAVRTDLARANAWRALVSLREDRNHRVRGTGRARLYNLRTEHPLSVAIASLFEAEEMRFAAIRDAVRDAASKKTLRPSRCLDYGSFRAAKTARDSDLDIVVVVEPSNLARCGRWNSRGADLAGRKARFASSVVGLDATDVERLARQRDPWWSASPPTRSSYSLNAADAGVKCDAARRH